MGDGESKGLRHCWVKLTSTGRKKVRGAIVDNLYEEEQTEKIDDAKMKESRLLARFRVCEMQSGYEKLWGSGELINIAYLHFFNCLLGMLALAVTAMSDTSSPCLFLSLDTLSREHVG